MRRLFFTVLFTTLISPAFGQEPDKVPLTVTRAQLQIIGQGLMELPYKTSADVMNALQQQLVAHDKGLADRAKAAEIEKAAPKKPD